MEKLPAGCAVINFFDDLHLTEADRTILFLHLVALLDLQFRILRAVAHAGPQVGQGSLVKPLERRRKYHLSGLEFVNQLVILGDLINHKSNMAAGASVGAIVEARALQISRDGDFEDIDVRSF